MKQPFISHKTGCLLVAAAAGLMAFLFLFGGVGLAFVAAAFIAIAIAVLVFLFLTIVMGRDLPKPSEVSPPGSVSSTSGAASATSASVSSASTAAVPRADPAPAEIVTETDAPEAAPEVKSASGLAGDVSGIGTSSDVKVIKPSAALAGEAELAERKGSWTYTPAPDASSDGTAKRGASSSGTETIASTEAVTSSEGTAGGATRPEGLAQARDGGADDLKKIKGIGPKLEILCNTLGFYHFDQIAGWGADEVAWVDQNLEGFKGRVTRDNWVEQAKLLATGGETEFSAKVDKGGVY